VPNRVSWNHIVWALNHLAYDCRMSARRNRRAYQEAHPAVRAKLSCGSSEDHPMFQAPDGARIFGILKSPDCWDVAAKLDAWPTTDSP
jgi:hypothetical protein